MASTGFTFAGTGANIAGANTDWVNPGNIVSDNATNATLALGSFNASDSLAATNFGFSLPTNVTINGVEARYDWDEDGTDDVTTVNLTKDGSTAVGGGKSLNSAFGPGFRIETIGGASDMWGTTLTKAEVEASTFGVMLSITEGDGVASNFAVDYVQINIHYTELVTYSNAPETIRIVSSGARFR